MKFKIVSSFLVLNLLTILFSNAQNGYFAKIYTSIQSVQIYDLLETKDNCFLMVGEKDGEAFIQKIDSVGQPLWQRKSVITLMSDLLQLLKQTIPFT